MTTKSQAVQQAPYGKEKLKQQKKTNLHLELSNKSQS